MVADKDPNINDPTATKVYLGHFPSGMSLKQALHFTQMVLAEKFQRYDYET